MSRTAPYRGQDWQFEIDSLREEFISAVAEVRPSVIAALHADVYTAFRPVYRILLQRDPCRHTAGSENYCSNPKFAQIRESQLEAARVLSAAIESWGLRFHLTDEWITDSFVLPTLNEAFHWESGDVPWWWRPGGHRQSDWESTKWRYDGHQPDSAPGSLIKMPWLVWHPNLDDVETYKLKAQNHFNRQLKSYISRVKASSAAKPVPSKRIHGKKHPGRDHFLWLAFYQTDSSVLWPDITHPPGEEETIKSAVRSTAKAIGLTLRKGSGGRPPKLRKNM